VVHALTAERDSAARENEALKQELGAFDAQFFDELESLKYNYSQAVALTHTLTEQIKQMKTAPRPAHSPR
jgi:hypothetical protein